MGRRRRSSGALAGWLFADLALMLSFVFLDSSVAGRSGTTGPSTSTSTTSTSISPPPSTTGPRGVDPEPIEVKIPTKLVDEPASFIQELERQILLNDSPKKLASRFLVVMVRVGSKNKGNRDFAAPLSERILDLIKKNWTKVEKGVTYYDTGDDTSIDFGLVKLKLFPVSD